MKRSFLQVALMFLFFGFFLFSNVISATAQNSLSGIVFDNNRQPVSDVYVELLDDIERLIASRKTRGGFYTFQKLSRGIYYLRVRVAGTSFKEQKIRIDLGDLNSIGGVDAKQQDIFLEVDSKRSGQTPQVTGVIFAQEVPADALVSYQNGLKNLNKNKTEDAIADLKMAIRIFPVYFNALEKLGDIYLSRQNFAEAEDLFKRAAAVNQKSFSSYFSLAIAQNKLSKPAEAVASLTKANEIDGNSINSHLLLGIIQRQLKQFSEAEKNLLKAKELSKNKEADVNWQLAELFYFDLKELDKAADELNSYLKNLSKTERRNNPKKIDGVKKLIDQIRAKAIKDS
jgi:tetratricopeptide (TPR) repeat protein